MQETNEGPSNQPCEHPQESSAIPLNLNAGEKITDCSALWASSDRVAEELGKCHSCNRPTFRVVTITSTAKLERRAALCGRHFVAAVKAYPQLKYRPRDGQA